MLSTRAGSVIPAVSFVVLGIINALNEKFLYEQEAQGLQEYGVHKFIKPFFFATMLFFGVSLSLFGYIIFSCCGRAGFPPISALPPHTFLEFVLPGFFGLFQGVMSSITTAMIGVSVDYMMRSATLIGVTLIARFWFKRTFEVHEWVGVVVVALSLVLVGMSSVLNAENSTTVLVSKKWAVVILLFKAVSQIAYSIKLSVEQYFTQQRRMPAMLVTGFESAWGFAIGAFVMLPIAHMMPGKEGNGLHEDILDTFEQMRGGEMIVIAIGMAICVECVYSISSVALTSATSAVVRTLLECFRNFLIWIVQLGLFYGLERFEALKKYRGVGEEWAKGSWIQLFGYAVLLVGLMMYGGSFSKKKKKSEMFELLDDTELQIRT